MPEFQLITEGSDLALSDFESGYIECIFFTNQCPADVVMDFSGDKVESRYISKLPRAEPQFIKADWEHPEIQEAIQEGSSDGCLPSDAGLADLHPDTLANIRADLAALYAAHKALFDEATARDDYDMAQAGRDVWFTREGHGVGFWDRKQLEAGDLGDRLSEAVGRTDSYVFYEPGYGIGF